jgi:hypothetical protein
MHIEGWMIAVLVLFFAFAGMAIYRCLLIVCRKLQECRRNCEQDAVRDGQT